MVTRTAEGPSATTSTAGPVAAVRVATLICREAGVGLPLESVPVAETV